MRDGQSSGRWFLASDFTGDHGWEKLLHAACRNLGGRIPSSGKKVGMASCMRGGAGTPRGVIRRRYFDSNGIPTQLVRSNGLEFMDADPALPAPLPAPIAPYRVPAGAGRHFQRGGCPRYRPFHRHQSSTRDASATGGSLGAGFVVGRPSRCPVCQADVRHLQ